MQIGNFHLGFTPKYLRDSERSEALASTFLKSINYTGSRYSIQKFKFRNYTSDQLVKKGYIDSSLASACISRYEVAYPEPDKIATLNGKEYNDPALMRLLQQPNQWMTETDFDRYTIKYQLLTGNCYWIIDRGSAYGEIKEIFPFNDMNVTPIATSDNFISSYRFITFDGHITEYRPEDVIHLPWMFINPFYPNKGISPGSLASRDIDTDTEFGVHIASFVSNSAEPGGIITVDKQSLTGAAGISEATLKKISQSFYKRFSKQGKGLPVVLEPGFDYKVTGSNLKDLDLQYARATQEARTCALYLIPPEVVGVNVGMAHSTENNLQSADIRWTNRTLIPLWGQNAKKLSAGLQYDFPGVKIEYDILNVASVKEQRQKELAGISTSLRAWMESYYKGSIKDREAAIMGAIYSFGIKRELAETLFAELDSSLSAVQIGAEGVTVSE